MLEDFEFTRLSLYLLCTFLVQYIWLRRHIFSIFDPLFYFVASTTFALTLSILIIDSPAVLWRVVLSVTLFLVGFTLTGRKPPRPIPACEVEVVDVEFFVKIIVAGAAAMIIFNSIGWVLRGIPLISNNPSLEKVDGLTGGLGFIRRFNWGIGVFVLIGSLYWHLATRSAASIAIFILIAITTALGGSKAALLPIIFAAGLYTARPFKSKRATNMPQKLKLAFPVITFLAIIPVVAVLLIENESIPQAFDALAVRLLYFGDVMLYWSRQDVRSAFSNLGPLDYPGHLFNGITGFLRLTDYDTPLGTIMVNVTLERWAELTSSIGPNTPFYVKGEVFFGPIVAPLYAFTVGMILKWFRVQFFGYTGHSLTRYSFLATLVILSSALPTEDSLFVVQLFDFLVFFSIIYFLILIPQRLLRRGNRTHYFK